MAKKTKAIKKSDIKGNKAWLRRGVSKSNVVAQKETNTSFLIVCEGQTEAHYFESFKSKSVTVRAIGLGSDSLQIVNCTIDMAEGKSYDQVWCVFDLDFKKDNPQNQQDFNGAIVLAKSNNIQCAYSNDAFELWFCLHYFYTDSQNHRSFYYSKLSELFNFNYEKLGKSRAYTKKHFDRLLEDDRASQSDAIQHAQKLCDTFKSELPSNQNPCTKVHLLVEELNKANSK